MSPRERRPEALVLDEGVLREGPICEIGGDLAVSAIGGCVVTPWRDRFRANEVPQHSVVAHAREVADASFSQVIVHLQKSRAATFCNLEDAWRILAPGGQLLLSGTNSLGVTSAVKRLASELEQQPIVVTNRARARVVRFKRGDGPGPKRETTEPFSVEIEGIDRVSHTLTLNTAPGVFSAKKLDAGSELLLQNLPRFIGHKPPKRIVDLGCGTGVLGISASTLYPNAECLLVDADARAVECAQSNVDRLGLSDRCRTAWWDAREQPLGDRFDLALVNPPFHHQGPEVDLGPALAFFESLSTWSSRNGRALIVANRTLPYEEILSDLGAFEVVDGARGYKLLSFKSKPRSGRSRGRSSPGARSAGRSNFPTRSR